MGIEAQAIQVFEVFLGPQEETGLAAAEDRRQLVSKVREEYVRLLNQYGKSDGSGHIIVKKPIGGSSRGFETIVVTSSRKCPDITVNSNSGQLKIRLNSFDHEDHPVKPYDPKTLEGIFPNDTAVLEIDPPKDRIAYPQWPLQLTFYIRPDKIEYTDSRMLGNLDDPLDFSKMGLQAPLMHLQNLLSLYLLLEEEYKKIPREEISVEPPASRPVLSDPARRFLSLIRRE